MEPLERLLQLVMTSNDPTWRQKVDPLLEELVARLLALEANARDKGDEASA